MRVFVFCLFCVWAVGGCERGGLFLCVLYFRSSVSVYGASVTDVTLRQNA